MTEPNQPEKGDLLVRQAEAKSHNDKVQRAEEARNQIVSEIKRLQDRLKEADNWIDNNPPIDMTSINEEIAAFDDKLLAYKDEVLQIRKYNAIVDTIITYNSKKSELNEVEKSRDAIQKEMNEISNQMKSTVSSLKIEELVPELRLVNEVDEDGNVKQGLFYRTDNGLLPFNRRQISYGKVLVALVKLSSYVNAGKLNIFHVPAWESLDEESRSEILAFAEQNQDLNIQFCIEEVKQELLGIKLIEPSDKK
jgi:predicted  nucleic acid-binding Zn-ribbon protein